MLLIIGIPSTVWVGNEIYHARTSNPGHLTTYLEYRERMPPAKGAWIMKREGTNYYAALGPIRAPLALPSGPPIYVFDSKGMMVDWTLDSGESPRFKKAWGSCTAERISVEALDEIMPPRSNTH